MQLFSHTWCAIPGERLTESPIFIKLASEMAKFNLPIKFLGRCPICNRQYLSGEATLINKEVGLSTIHVKCFGCQSSIIIGVMSGVMGIITTIGMATDLNKKDAISFYQAPAINFDKVLEVHRFFQSTQKKKKR